MARLTERVGDLISAVALFGIGSLAIIGSWLMPPRRLDDMGPGFFPSILGIILCVASVGIGAKSFRHRAASKEIQIIHRDSWSIVAGTIVMAFLFKPIGALPVTGLYVLFLLKLLTNLGWGKGILLAAASAVVTYLFFDLLLGIPLSGGMLF